MKLAILSSAIAATTAFTTPSTTSRPSFAIQSAEVNQEETVAEPAAPAVTPINGWVPDEYLPCYGLPGALAPTGFFDPLGFAQTGISLNEIKRNREAEVMHGRVAMIAAVGYLAGESIDGPFNIVGPANDQLQQMPLPAFALLTAGIAAAELKRATIGWVEPDVSSWTKTLWKLRDNYYPGDVGFDPLGLSETQDMYTMMEAEIRHSRLAMLAVIGWPLSELVGPKFMLHGSENLAPSVLNGFDPLSFIAVAGILGGFGYFEYKTALRRTDDKALGKKHMEDMKNVWKYGVPGDYNFDPLNLYSAFGDDAAGRKAMRELEVAHGRSAMLGITADRKSVV